MTRWVRWRRTLRTPLGVTSVALLGFVLVLAVVAPMIWNGRAAAVDTNALSQGFSSRHWLGTDNLGRDIFARVLVATRLSVELALLAASLGVVTGVLLGSVPVLFGRRVARMATAVITTAVAFPGLLLALFFAVVFGVGVKGAVLAIGFANAPWLARVTQTLVAGVQERDFIAAARMAGVGRFRTLVRHVLPNIGEPLAVNATIAAGGALLSFAGLSFLGLGVQAPSYDWGLLLGEGLNGIYLHPAGALAPGMAIVIAGLAFNLVGEVVAKQLGLRTAAGAPGVADAPGPFVPVDVSGPSAAPRAVGEEIGEETRTAAEPVLVVEDLRVRIPVQAGVVEPVRQVSFTVERGEAVGVVGESGSGKSLTALAVARLIEPPIQVEARRLRFQGTDLLAGDSSRITRTRLLGTSLGLVFQDPATSLNPTMRIGRQLTEGVRRHLNLDRRQALARAVDRLRDVRVPAAERRIRQYPHEFSGGMRQRAMIAMAVMGDPALIVADEPTTALDVTVQRQVLRLFQRIRVADRLSLLLISHDITVVGQVCDRVLVMYAGRVVEDLPSRLLWDRARHPYTRALLAAVPDMTVDRDRPLATIPGHPADPANPPPGCAFAPRCPLADDRCRAEDPPLTVDHTGHRVACWRAKEGA